jgi:hypothetical protein
MIASVVMRGRDTRAVMGALQENRRFGRDARHDGNLDRGLVSLDAASAAPSDAEKLSQ